MYAFDRIDLFSDPSEGKVNARWALGFPREPWEDYDPSVEARVPGGYRGDPESVRDGFFPMPPQNGPKAYRVARIEADLAKVEQSLAEGNLVPRAKFHAVLSKHMYRSWLAQLRDKEEALPPGVGNEYVHWVRWLRAHDPGLGGDPSWRTTEDDLRRTEQAVERNIAKEFEKREAHFRRLEERGVLRRYFPGKELRADRLPG